MLQTALLREATAGASMKPAAGAPNGTQPLQPRWVGSTTPVPKKNGNSVSMPHSP